MIWTYAVEAAVEEGEHYFKSNVFCICKCACRDPDNLINPVGNLVHPLCGLFLVSRSTKMEVEGIANKKGPLRFDICWCEPACKLCGEGVEGFGKSWTSHEYRVRANRCL